MFVWEVALVRTAQSSESDYPMTDVSRELE